MKEELLIIALIIGMILLWLGNTEFEFEIKFPEKKKKHKKGQKS